MIKKILPTMIGAALTVGMTAAAADVTVFGHIDTAIVSADADKGLVNTTGIPNVDDTWTGRRDVDDTNFVCTTCSIGFKGSEDLGNGLKAIFKLDFQYDTINRNKDGSFTDRDQWLGLAGVFGSVKVGTISTPYKSHGAMIDPLYRTAAQGRTVGLQSFMHNGAGENGQGRADNTARWDSPSWNGLKASAYYTLDSSKSANKPDGIFLGEDDDGYGAGVSYKNGGILVFADYVTNNSDEPSVKLSVPGPNNIDGNYYGDMRAWKIGGKYTFDNFAVMGQFEDIDQDRGNSEKTEVWHVAGSYTMGNNLLYAGYGQAQFQRIQANAASTAIFGVPGADGDSDQTSYTIAGVHNLSKRTSIYLAYFHIEQDNDSILDLENTLTISGGSADSDPEADVFALGMKHKF